NLAVERVTRLQEITAAFAETILPEEVFEVIFKEVFQALGVSSGSVGVLDSQRENITIQRIEGYHIKEIPASWKQFPLSTKAPMSDAIRSGRPIYFHSLEEILNEYPFFA